VFHRIDQRSGKLLYPEGGSLARITSAQEQ
jgi:hypothetical protein